MRYRSLLQSCSILCLTLLSSAGMAAEPLQPRVELNVRSGTDRAILMTEFWAPLAQQSDQVFYSDIRLMGDGDDNREGNLGFGYREIVPQVNSVLGVNAWIDRRHTQRNATFHQATIGLEALGKSFDARFNVYLPLGDKRQNSALLVGNGTGSPYLAGTGIFYDTNGIILEEAQRGFDAELGYRLPVLENKIDSIRIYGGGYSFTGSQTKTVAGYRARAEVNVTADVGVGTRFQYDGQRGSQAFLEATLRFPFSSKKSFQKEGLRARLDESPERDIDIVTNNVVTNPGKTAQPVLNADTGQLQRVIYVDNSAAAGGTGSKENPLNTLAAAQAILQDNDVLYIKYGDGTTNGQNTGLSITQSKVQIIGSGTNFIYDGNKYKATNGLNYTGALLAAGGAAPVITNTQTFSTPFTGNGITVTGNDVSISGLTIANAQGNGIFGIADGQNLSGLTIHDVNVTGNNNGLMLAAYNGGTLSSANLLNIKALNNATNGILMDTDGVGGDIGTVNLTGIESSNNGYAGILAFAGSVNTIDKINLNGALLQNNSVTGFLAVGLGQINDLSLDSVEAKNGQSGIELNMLGTGNVGKLNITNSVLSLNDNGIKLGVEGGTLTNAMITNTRVSQNNQNGILVETGDSDGTISNLVIDHVLATQNTDNGIYILGQNEDSITNTVIKNTDVTKNQNSGVLIEASQQLDSNFYLNNVTLSNITALENKNGLDVFFNQIGMQNLTISDIYAYANTQSGVLLRGINANFGTTPVLTSIKTYNNLNGLTLDMDNATLDDIQINGLDASGNIQNGMQFVSSNIVNNSIINNSTFNNLILNGNGQNGWYSKFRGSLYKYNVTNIQAKNNGVDGINLTAVEGRIGGYNYPYTNPITNADLSNNGRHGLYGTTQGNGNIAIQLSDVIANNNVGNGLYILGQQNGTIFQSEFTNIIASHNGKAGIAVDAENSYLYSYTKMENVTAEYNVEQGIRYSSTNTDGSSRDMYAWIINSKATHNGLDGIKISGINSNIYNNANNNNTGNLIANTVVSDNGRSGISLYSEGVASNSLTLNGTLDGITATNNGLYGIGINTIEGNVYSNSGKIITNSTVTGNTSDGINITLKGTGTYASIGIYSGMLNVVSGNNGGNGIVLDLDRVSSYGDSLFDNVITNSNHDNGIYITSSVPTSSNGLYAGMKDVESRLNGQSGIVYNLNNIYFNNTPSQTFNNIIVSDNNAYGLYYGADGGGSHNGLNFNNMIANNNKSGGISINLTNTASNVYLNNTVFNNVTANNNIGTGISFNIDQTNVSNVIYANAINFTNVTTNSNTVDGIGISSPVNVTGYDTFTQGLTMTGSTSNGNGGNGMKIVTGGNSNYWQFANNNFTNNGLYGFALSHNPENPAFILIDFGGGYNSVVGNNNFSGNTLAAMSLDANGAVIKAENNYWGVGGFQPSSVVLIDGTTIDASPEKATP